MKCVNCGFEIEEGQEFCVNCGKEVAITEYPHETVSNETLKIIEENVPLFTTKKVQKNPYTIGMIISVIAIVVSLFVMFGTFEDDAYKTFSDITTHTEYAYYGGDAYTGMQQASADASNNAAVAAKNVKLNNEMLCAIKNSTSTYTGIILFFAGALSFSYFYAGYKKEAI